MIVRDDHSVAFAKGLRADGPWGPRMRSCGRSCSAERFRSRSLKSDPSTAGQVESELYLVTSRPLQNPSGPTRQHGVLISTQKIDDAWRARFQRITAMDMQFEPPQDISAGSHAERALAAADGIALSEPSDDQVEIFVRVDDVTGKAPLVAVVQAPRLSSAPRAPFLLLSRWCW